MPVSPVVDIEAAAEADRCVCFDRFHRDRHDLDETLGSRTGEDVVRASPNTATTSAPVAAYARS